MSLVNLHTDPPYIGYSYAYPHKTSYRHLVPPVSLEALWASETKNSLFLYIHIPFCGTRCAFCNLFSLAHPRADMTGEYINTLRRHAYFTMQALGNARFSRIALGGGTPTYLDPGDLESLFDISLEIMGADSHLVPVSVETSPKTADSERLNILKDRGTDRISIGVQSFDEKDMAALGRYQKKSDVKSALERICDLSFPVLNIDLIYGIPGQTVKSWLCSVHEALQYMPEEIYLYPLYIRPCTGMWQKRDPGEDIRLTLYREARKLLSDAGYEQLSMRMFRAAHAPGGDGPVYCCQEDGMIGLGCGPRSYTRTLHYSAEYAISPGQSKNIIQDYIARSDRQFQIADYGIRLDPENQKRRYAIKSVLRSHGLSVQEYEAFFGTCVFEDLPFLSELEKSRFAICENNILRLTPAGLERSDVIGPWLYSQKVVSLMNSFDLQ